MSLSNVFVKVVGVIIVIFGLGLLAAALGLPFIGVGFQPAILEAIIGLLLIGVGIFIINGGNITA